jgi:hypothetical protein
VRSRCCRAGWAAAMGTRVPRVKSTRKTDTCRVNEPICSPQAQRVRERDRRRGRMRTRRVCHRRTRPSLCVPACLSAPVRVYVRGSSDATTVRFLFLSTWLGAPQSVWQYSCVRVCQCVCSPRAERPSRCVCIRERGHAPCCCRARWRSRPHQSRGHSTHTPCGEMRARAAAVPSPPAAAQGARGRGPPPARG